MFSILELKRIAFYSRIDKDFNTTLQIQLYVQFGNLFKLIYRYSVKTFSNYNLKLPSLKPMGHLSKSINYSSVCFVLDADISQLMHYLNPGTNTWHFRVKF